jgi:acyl-CoA thioester hydrolase
MDYVEVPVRVRYADTDRMGIVYYGTYPQYFEIGRTELMRNKGLTYRQLEEMGYHLVVTGLEIKYFGSATYDDLLLVRVRVAELQSRGITFQYQIFKDGNRVVEGKTKHICVNSERKAVRLPPALPKLFIDAGDL